MGSCAGKSNSAVVVSAHIQPVDPNNPPPNTHAAQNHNENQQQVPQPNKYQEVQKPNDPNQYIVQHPDAQNQYQQPQPQAQRDEHSNNTTKPEEKFNKPQHGYDDLDEDAFASQLNKKEAPKITTEKKKENNPSSDTFALNFPANQFISNDNTKKEGKVIEENKRYQSKHKEKNVKNIIDNPDEMEQSFSSQGEARKIIENGDDDDFDVVENAKRNSHRANEKNTRDHKHQQSSRNSSQQNLVIFHDQKQPNRASLTESASPSSGVIKNKTPEKEKIIEVKETHPIVQEQHHEIIHHEHNEHNEHHEHHEHHRHHGHHHEHHELVQEEHEIIHHEPEYVQEKKVHKEEEPAIHHQQEKKIEKVKSPERVLETRKENVLEEPMMKFDDPPLKIIDTPQKNEKASPQKNTMKVSQEKMPWERNSVPFDDENEIEFFDDELES